MALAERAELVARLSLKDEFTAKLRDAAKGMKDLDKATSNTQKSLGTFGHNIERAAVVGATAFTGAVIGAVKLAGDFEASLHTINTVAGATPEQLGKIGDAIRQLARDTGTPLEDLTSAYYDLVSAGIKTADAQKVLTAANTLAIGGIASTAQTVDLLTTAINAYGGDASKAAEYADAFAEAIAAGKVTAAEISESFAQIGPLAAQSGISLNEIAAALAVMTANGTPAAEAFTQMRSALVALQKPTGDLESLQKKLGVDFYKIAQDKGLAFAYNELEKAADKAGIQMVTLTGRVEGSLFAAQVAGPNFAKYSAELDKVGKSAGTASAQMAEREQGLNYQLAKLVAGAKDAGITIGSALLPKLTPLIAQLNTFLSQNQDKIADFGSKLAEGFQNFADFAGKVDFSGISGALKISADATKTIVDSFLKLPPGIQSALVVGLAVNKVTGGLPVSVIKDAAGFFFNRLQTINAANVTVVGGNVTTGAGGAAGAAAGVTGVRAILGSLLVAGTILEIATIIGPPIRDWAIDNGLAGSGDSAGKTDSQLARERADAAMNPLSGKAADDVIDVHVTGTEERPGKMIDDLVSPLITDIADLRNTINNNANAARDDVNAQINGTLDAVQAIKDGNDLVKVYTSGTAVAQRGEAHANDWIGRNIEILTSLQQKFIASGDTATAAALGADIEQLRQTVAANTPNPALDRLTSEQRATVAALTGGALTPKVTVNVETTVKSNIFGTTATNTVYSRYNSSNGAIVV